MPKRIFSTNSNQSSNKKIIIDDPNWNKVELKPGEILQDLAGKEWLLGENIGYGGFGVIHGVTERFSKEKNKYVVKIEPHINGPLFSEINCYLRIGKKEIVDEWTKKKGLHILGIPHYVASGSHIFNGIKYRFLVIPRYKKDLETILEEKKKFNLKTVLLISSQILQALEYIHEKGYIHSDIKAANIMLNRVTIPKSNDISLRDVSTYSKSPVTVVKRRRELRTCRVKKLVENEVIGKRPYNTRNVNCVDYNIDHLLNSYAEAYWNLKNEKWKCEKLEKNETVTVDQLYLLDFGLASKYRLSSGEHKKCGDERKAHAGTLLFCSRDAHKGIQSRRSDLESLAYNMVYWLTGSLPWIDDLEDPEMTQRKKRHCFIDISGFLYFCMPDPPRILQELFQYVKGLDVLDRPDYTACRQFIRKALNEYGYYDEKFDFDNLEGWGLSKKKSIKKLCTPTDVFRRPPLLSNMPVKPILRKKTKKKAQAALKWSMMLSNPEVLLKRVRDKKIEANDVPTVFNFDLEKMNPTPAMREVFKKFDERKGHSPIYSGQNSVINLTDGYTPAMEAVKQKMLEMKEIEDAAKPNKKKTKKTKKSKVNNGKDTRRVKQQVAHPTRTYCLRG